jgi:hypothetical protein
METTMMPPLVAFSIVANDELMTALLLATIKTWENNQKNSRIKKAITSCHCYFISCGAYKVDDFVPYLTLFAHPLRIQTKHTSMCGGIHAVQRKFVCTVKKLYKNVIYFEI